MARWTSARTAARRPPRPATPAPTCAAAGSDARHLRAQRGARRCSRSTGPSGATRSTAPTAAALHDAFEAFCADDGARVLVLTGAGEEAFCAGADLKAIDTLGPGRAGRPARLHPPTSQADDRRDLRLVPGRRLRARALVRPAGAPPSARFGFAERRWGVPLIDGGTQRLPRIVGEGRALDLVLSGRVIGAGRRTRSGSSPRSWPAGATSSARSRWRRRSRPSRRRRC